MTTALDWPRRRAEILETWHKAMGPWPARIEKPKVETVQITRRENVTQHQLRLGIALDGEMVDAFLLVPDGFGTLMDRVHLTASQTGGNPAAAPTAENLRKSGYQLRGWLTVQKIAEIKRRVLD
ncbi:MAG TPA: hypothetical protein VEL76_26200 [Gemmataceae bacterium]|nr:hypothetical protein [Gemmataceae bacterium]